MNVTPIISHSFASILFDFKCSGTWGGTGILGFHDQIGSRVEQRLQAEQKIKEQI